MLYVKCINKLYTGIELAEIEVITFCQRTDCNYGIIAIAILYLHQIVTSVDKRIVKETNWRIIEEEVETKTVISIHIPNMTDLDRDGT